MGENSDIEWLGHNPVTGTRGASGSPWEGCTHVHEGCRNCWAEALNRRWRGGKNWGIGAPRRGVTGFEANARAFARTLAKNGERASWFPSICDPLDPEVWLLRATAADKRADRSTATRFMQTIRETGRICDAPGSHNMGTHDSGHHESECRGAGIDWLLLTKRPENWAWIPEDVRRYCWLLYSASDQKSLEAGIGHLLSAQGFAGLGLSLEPLIGPVTLRPEWLRRLGWLIAGGESGQKARPHDIAWPRSIIAQCRAAGVPVFNKQLGAFPHSGEAGSGWATVLEGRGRHWRWDDQQSDVLHVYAQYDKKGGDMSEWPEDLRVREFPEALRRAA